MKSVMELTMIVTISLTKASILVRMNVAPGEVFVEMVRFLNVSETTQVKNVAILKMTTVMETSTKDKEMFAICVVRFLPIHATV